jgi:hypothetical protein
MVMFMHGQSWHGIDSCRGSAVVTLIGGVAVSLEDDKAVDSCIVVKLLGGHGNGINVSIGHGKGGNVMLTGGKVHGTAMVTFTGGGKLSTCPRAADRRFFPLTFAKGIKTTVLFIHMK